MSAIYDVTQLRVYQRALRLYPFVIRLANQLPEKFKKQKIQLINSGCSIAPLIAEGFAKKRNDVEAKRFYEMAMAESDELITHIRQVRLLTAFVRSVKTETCDALIERYKMVSKELQNLKKRWNISPNQ